VFRTRPWVLLLAEPEPRRGMLKEGLAHRPADVRRIERRRGASKRARLLPILTPSGVDPRAEGLASPRANLCDHPRAQPCIRFGRRSLFRVSRLTCSETLERFGPLARRLAAIRRIRALTPSASLKPLTSVGDGHAGAPARRETRSVFDAVILGFASPNSSFVSMPPAFGKFPTPCCAKATLKLPY